MIPRPAKEKYHSADLFAHRQILLGQRKSRPRQKEVTARCNQPLRLGGGREGVDSTGRTDEKGAARRSRRTKGGHALKASKALTLSRFRNQGVACVSNRLRARSHSRLCDPAAGTKFGWLPIPLFFLFASCSSKAWSQRSALTSVGRALLQMLTCRASTTS